MPSKGWCVRTPNLANAAPVPSGVVGGASDWGEFVAAVGGRRPAVVSGLGGLVLVSSRACKMFAVSNTATHVVHGLRRGTVAYFCDSVHLRVAQWPSADRVEVRVRSLKGDQLRQGAVLTRARDGSPQRVEEGGWRQ